MPARLTTKIALLLVAVWPAPPLAMLTLVIGGIAAIYGGPAMWRVWRSDARIGDAGQIAAIVTATVVLPAVKRALGDGTLALLGAGVAGAVAAFGWRCATRR